MDLIETYNKAFQHHMSGELDSAVGIYREIVRVFPRLAVAQTNLGTALNSLGKTEEAIASYEAAICADPSLTSIYVNFIPLLRNIGRLEEAEAMSWRFLEVAPDDPSAYSILIQILVERERFEAAIYISRIAPAASKESMGYWLGYGGALSGIGQRGAAEAVDAFRKAITFEPERNVNHFGLAEALLRQGDFIEGWTEFEWVLPYHDLPRPPWKGEDPQGKTILIYQDLGIAAGFGDVFHLVRYLPMVEARGARVLLQVMSPAVRLLAASFPSVTVIDGRGATPAFDYHTTLMRLPGLFGTTLETIPATVPYVRAVPAEVERWQERLAGLKGLKIGLVWAGQRRLNEHGFERDDYRHTTLARVERLLKIEGVSFVSLQTGPQALEIRALADPSVIFDPMGGIGGFADTAALISALDLIISVDTSVAHLSGALGKPVWIMMAYNACGWRWMMDREDSPWYPTARIVRQKAAGAWSEVVRRVEGMVRKVVAGEATLTGAG